MDKDREVIIFTREDVLGLLKKENYYTEEVKERVAEIIMSRTRKYGYLWS